jgi:hypothetical protein
MSTEPRHSRGTHASPPRGLARAHWAAIGAVLILLGTGAGIWALARGGPAPAAVVARPAPASALMTAVRQADQIGAAKGELPPASCRQQGTTQVTCTSPAPAISWATFRTFPSLTGLYSAYVAAVQAVHPGPFTQNTGDCGLAAPGTNGDEIAWNHHFQHSRAYTVAQMTTGTVTDTDAVGRVFCITVDGTQEEMVWTQDDGHLLGMLGGTDHEAVWYWWAAVHHNIVFGGPVMPMP